ncbi:MAG: hypothetical protein FJ304_05470 [Planctomycetes bacterium]|nr:hypothetical protein [Planctomycetota bacterium]
MTTLAKIEANRRNAALSTGPRTDAGKARVARNAVTHGIFAQVPVVPGECAATWDAHRAGVVAALDPAGLLELALAERAALLLWRLQRVARYEVEAVAAAMDAAEVPPVPEPEDSLPEPFPVPQPKTREEQLWDTREALRKARRAYAEIVPARDVLAPDPADESAARLFAALPPAAVSALFEAARGRVHVADGAHPNPPRYDTKAFRKALALSGDTARAVAWTPEMIGRGLSVYAGFAREPVEGFIEGVRTAIVERAEELGRAVRRLERDEAALVRLLDEGAARARAVHLLPPNGGEERVAKYERHLHTLLTSTLHELERLQARRDGDTVVPPVVADVNVTVDGAAP